MPTNDARVKQAALFEDVCNQGLRYTNVFQHEEIKLSEKLQKMYKEFLIYVEQENVEFERTESKKLELQLKEKIQWLKRYLVHLEKGGKRIQAGADYWAQHQNHKLIIEYGEDEQGNIDQEILFLWCETCSDIVSSHIKKSDGNREFEKIKNHLNLKQMKMKM